MKARILVFLGVWVVIGLVVFSIPGCYGRNCEATFATFGVDAGQGEMISENEWESNAQDGEWLYFPRQRSYLFNITAWGGRTPFQVIPYLSAPGLRKGSELTPFGVGSHRGVRGQIGNRL